MSVIAFARMAAGVLAACASVLAQSTPDAFLLASARAGAFELGMTVDQVIAQASRQNVRLVATFPEGMFQPELEIDLRGFPSGPALVAPIREWPCGQFALWGLSVRDPRFRTANGLGVGSTLGDLRKQYPGVRVTNIDADGGPSVVISEAGLTFKMERARAYTDASRVESVWVIPQPAAVRDRKCPERR